MHVPAPLQVADHIGQDTPRETLLKEVLALTKLNWNSAALGGLLPITIKVLPARRTDHARIPPRPRIPAPVQVLYLTIKRLAPRAFGGKVLMSAKRTRSMRIRVRHRRRVHSAGSS
jgi:hypothetical protein